MSHSNSRPPDGPGARVRSVLLLADISGYTGFLQGVADAHFALVIESDEPPKAYALMSSLLDQIVSAISPYFRLAKLEGDAVFATAPDDSAPRGETLLLCVRACHAAFTSRLAEASDIWSCQCDACSRVGQLNLKFVLHHGDVMVQRIAGSEELLGPDVNVAHRLLKNHVHEMIGEQPYALFTDQALAALAVPDGGMLPITETYEHMPAIEAHVLPLP